MAEASEDADNTQNDIWLNALSESQAEGDDREEQENELMALEAIYDCQELEIITHDNKDGHLPGGIFTIPVHTPSDFYVRITKDMRLIRRMAFAHVHGRGRSEKIRERAARRRAASLTEEPTNNTREGDRAAPGVGDTPLGDTAGSGKCPQQDRLYPIKRLPPITLTFAYTQHYPSKSAPHFTLSCCWLEKKNLSRLCEHLDDLWNQYNGMPIVSVWYDFLYNDVLEFLGIKSPYDLGRVLVHLYTHPKGYNGISGLKPRPFDSRAIQAFSHIDEVLPRVLEYNLTVCEVCFEEKPGSDMLRLVNCTEHCHCRACMKSWLECMITDGAVTDLRCPGYQCEKPILPTEVASVVSEDQYQRYDKLLLRTALDVMPDMLNCPRPFCQFPVVLEDNLGHCPKCSYAFCSRCQNTYHGYSPCKLKSEFMANLSAEYEAASKERRKQLEMTYSKQVLERAVNETRSNQWLESNSKQCPNCSTFIQKKDGCNKMTCTKCRAFFCWLCNELLSKSTPYAHYQHPTSPCANRLFEGVEQDDDDDGLDSDSSDDSFNEDYAAIVAALQESDNDEDGVAFRNL